MLSKLGGTKFIFCVLFSFLGYTLVWKGMVKTMEWFDFIKFMGSAYILGNVGADVVSKMK